MTMKIIAANAIPAGAEDQKTLEIANDVELAELVASGALDGVARVELQFPKFTDGRAYSQAFLLRRRLGFQGEIRATGDVLIDQLLQMQRTGFDCAVLREDQNADFAQAQLERYAAFYQGDAATVQPQFVRGVAA